MLGAQSDGLSGSAVHVKGRGVAWWYCTFIEKGRRTVDIKQRVAAKYEPTP
jgi:hypothetical protein